MSAFPKNITITIGKSVMDTVIRDAETGDQVRYVKGIRVDLSSDGKMTADVAIDLCGVAMTVEAEEARYVLDEETLRRLAADNGFDLVARTSGEPAS